MTSAMDLQKTAGQFKLSLSLSLSGRLACRTSLVMRKRPRSLASSRFPVPSRPKVTPLHGGGLDLDQVQARLLAEFSKQAGQSTSPSFSPSALPPFPAPSFLDFRPSLSSNPPTPRVLTLSDPFPLSFPHRARSGQERASFSRGASGRLRRSHRGSGPQAHRVKVEERLLLPPGKPFFSRRWHVGSSCQYLPSPLLVSPTISFPSPPSPLCSRSAP